jgi:ATP phosphoribosyltransferase
MKDGVNSLLADSGIQVKMSDRGYRPQVNLPDCQVKILKPQSIVEMLHVGSRDLGFAGADWVQELKADLVELVDTKLDPVKVVAAAPENLLVNGKLPNQRLVIASEYETLTRDWIERTGLDANFVRSFGATEVLPPEDADCIVDNTATGSTLRANNLAIIEVVATSSTRLYASPKAMQDPAKKQFIEHFSMLVQSVLAARGRVMVEVNVDSKSLEGVIKALPCMREPTVSPLRGDTGYAVKAAVPRDKLPLIIPEIKAAGGTDVVVTSLAQIIP